LEKSTYVSLRSMSLTKLATDTLKPVHYSTFSIAAIHITD